MRSSPYDMTFTGAATGGNRRRSAIASFSNCSLRDRRKEEREREREREKNAKWKIPLPFLPAADPLPLSNFNACYIG